MARRRSSLDMPKSRSMVPNSASAAGVACAAGEADRESIASPPGGKGFEPGREQGFHGRGSGIVVQPALAIGAQSIVEGLDADPEELGSPGDRKSTRLNSSHVAISYSVFCLKKKKR